MLPTFVISLPDSIERRNVISSRLADLGVEFEWVDAVDGRNGLHPELEEMVDRKNGLSEYGQPLEDAEFACALSHIRACRLVVDRDLPHALILEDDAIPQPDLVPYLAGEFYADTELTSLYCGSTWVHKNGKKLFGEYTSHLCVPMARTPGMVGYIVSQDAARHIVEEAVPVDREADRMRCADQLKLRGKWRVVLPHLVEHTSDASSILDEYGRASRRRKKPRLLGIYVPPLHQMARSLKLGAFGRFMGIKKIRKQSVSRVFYGR